MRILIKIPNKLLRYKSRFLSAISRGADRVEDTMLLGIQNSIKRRWFRTGNSLNKITSTQQIVDDGVKITVLSGTEYDQFGEYGTGKRGSSKRPSFVPSGYTYGIVLGMDPRFMFHTGLEEVLPEIRRDFAKVVKKAL